MRLYEDTRRVTHTYECVGGPADGDAFALPAGACDIMLLAGACWHRYSVQATDLGMMLVWSGLAH